MTIILGGGISVGVIVVALIVACTSVAGVGKTVNKKIEANKEHKVQIEQRRKEDAVTAKYFAEANQPNLMLWVNQHNANSFMNSTNKTLTLVGNEKSSDHFNFLTLIDPREFNVSRQTTNEYTITKK